MCGDYLFEYILFYENSLTSRICPKPPSSSIDDNNPAIVGQVQEPRPPPALDHAHVVREPGGHPSREALVQVEAVVQLDEAVVAEDMAPRRNRPALEDEEVVAAVLHPQPEHGQGDPDLDCGVEAAWLLVVEVSGDAGPEQAAHWLTASKQLQFYSVSHSSCLVSWFEHSECNKYTRFFKRVKL